MGPPSSHRIPRVRWYLGYRLCVFTFHLQDSHLLRLAFPRHSVTLPQSRYIGPYPIGITTYGLASSAFARHYSRNLGWFLFLSLLRCFSSGGSPRNAMDSRYVPLVLHQGGFPIRKSADIMLICSSPQLIAACHVLLRLLMPRHSPCALFRLNFPIRSLGIAWVS